MPSDRINFRCSAGLRRKLEEAARRSHVSLSEQARVSLEKLYEVKEEELKLWLPPLLREKEGSPNREGHHQKA